MNRRGFVTLVASTTATALSGCTFGREDHYPVSVENRSGDERDVRVELKRGTTVGVPGTTEYTDEELTLESDDAIARGDAPPEHVWATVHLDGTLVVDDEYPFPDERVRITIRDAEAATVESDP